VFEALFSESGVGDSGFEQAKRPALMEIVAIIAANVPVVWNGDSPPLFIMGGRIRLRAFM
jgi:hypothetical protein